VGLLDSEPPDVRDRQRSLKLLIRWLCFSIFRGRSPLLLHVRCSFGANTIPWHGSVGYSGQIGLHIWGQYVQHAPWPSKRYVMHFGHKKRYPICGCESHFLAVLDHICSWSIFVAYRQDSQGSMPLYMGDGHNRKPSKVITPRWISFGSERWPERMHLICVRLPILMAPSSVWK